jgi:flagellar hook-associated protein 2
LAEVATDISSTALSAVGQKIDPNATLESQKSKFVNPWSGTALEFKITTYNPDGTPNSKTFAVDTTVDSLNSVIARINAETSLGVTAFYEPSTDKVVISTKKTGNYATNEIEIEDVTGTFALGTLALAATAQGKNAILDINGLTGIQQYENTFTLNKITFTIKKTTTSPVLVTVSNDTDHIFNTVKNFVDQFNSLLDTIKKELTEERYPDYLPLTEEQKEQLTDKQIEQWEEKAKSGLLRNDPILSDIVYRLRRALTAPVTGLTGYDSLFDIGIRTGYYWEGGKLYIDEAALREAINANPEAVMNLFTKNAAAFDSQGLGVRLYDEVSKAINRINAQAGSAAALYDNSFLSRSIRDLDERIDITEERLKELEDRYWRQFAALEQALAAMQAQSDWLAGIASQTSSMR